MASSNSSVTKRFVPARVKAARNAYESWMRRYWQGVSLSRFHSADEYESLSAQVGWELWQRFEQIASRNCK